LSHEMKHITDELLVKYLLEACDAQEIEQVTLWLNQNEENLVYYKQLKKIWDESASLASAPPIDTDDAWLRLKQKMQTSKQGFSLYRNLYYAAASILLLLGLFGAYKYVNQEPKTNTVEIPIAIAPKLLESNKTTIIDTLSDQSIVTLNKNATLAYPSQFKPAERRVTLTGEAFFNISPNKSQPFYINASNDVEIKVIGTSFNVKSFDAYTEVIVETGIVEVRKFNRVILLHPHEKARIDKEDSTIVVEKNKDKLYKYFRSKEFECDNTPLWRVVEVLNEAYGDSVVIGRSDLKSLTLTTRFDNESLESILEIISETFEINVEKKGNKYILK